MRFSAELQTGDLSSANWFRGFAKNPAVIALRGQLEVKLVVAAIRAPNGEAPHEGENATDYITRIADEAMKRKDWRRLKEISDGLTGAPAALNSGAH